MFGYAGQMLFVDLDDLSYEIRPLSEDLAKNFVSGAALGAKIIYDEMPAHTDPFSSDSMLGILSGVLNGNGVLYGGRFTVCSKSPVTGGWNDSNCGGKFGPALKSAGFDAIFVRGIAKEPVYIWIDDGEVEIRDASKYWGMLTVETEDALREDLGDKKIECLMIGPGGENVSYMAGIVNDKHRIAARGGTGAVMGSKKLKAVAVRGSRKMEVADRETIVADNKRIKNILNTYMKPVYEGFGGHGTAGTFDGAAMSNDVGIKNWGGKGYEDYAEEDAVQMSTSTMDEKYKVRRYGCHSCPMRCGAYYRVNDERWPMENTGRPEYETIGAFSTSCLITDPVAVIKCNDLCNEYGIDTISVGNTVAWAMECYENGLITIDQLDGIDLRWGNAEGTVELVEKIGKGEGCGKIFGLGSYRASLALGVGKEYLVVANGVEFPMHDARLAPGLARTYKFDPTPARHVKGTSRVGAAANPPEVRYNYEDTGFDDLVATVASEIDNSAGICYFGSLMNIVTDASKPVILKAVTGFDYDRASVHQLGIRMFTIRHAFNLREGLTRKDYFMSDRIYRGNTENNGLFEGIDVDVEKLGDNFFAAMGYDRDMKPTLAALEIMGGMENVIADLYPPESQ